ncbi:hypothetical protein E5D57_013162 [Metarhizium anisopliae]|nr:hypothetical protein E5D57_013162 [Metarhizium anisopliae]
MARLSRYTDKPPAKKRKKNREDTGLCEFLSSIANNPSVPLPSFDLKRDGWELKLLPEPADKNQDTQTSLVRFSNVLETHPSAMSTEQKLKLALDVAWTVLYLSHTPWLRSRWTSDDIYVIQKSGHTIPNAFTAHANGGTMMETAAGSESSIFALGIFLTELSFGAPWPDICRLFVDNHPIMELFDPQHVEEAWDGIDAVINNNNIAPWDRPFYREGPSYYEATRNCVRGGNFDRYFTNVIQPLEFAVEDYNQHQLYGPILDDFSELGLGTNEASDDTVFARLFDDRDARAGTEERAESWFDDYYSVVLPIFRDRPTGYGNRIRVAILDTGVDLEVNGIREALKNGQLHYQNFANGHDFAPDTDGHGTAVTSLLLRVAPNADVYVARVTSDGVNWDYTKFCEVICICIIEGCHADSF